MEPIQRHTYSSHTPTGTAPSSPLSLPPLLADEEPSPVSTSSPLDTPFSSPVAHTATIVSSHSELSSLAHMPTPPLGSSSDDYSPRQGFPLLPPHHPLRKKLFTSYERDAPSPPSTPKGHPLESRSAFPFSKAKMLHPISNPYRGVKQSYSSTLTYLLRVPRRLRPALLIGFCLATFALVFLGRAWSEAGQLDAVVQRNKMLGRRFIEVEGLVGINDRRKQAVLSDVDAEEAVHSAFSTSHSTASLSFESHSEELAALISFVTSTTANALPHDMDPTRPLDPHVVLDFDPSRPDAREDLELLQAEINIIYPVVLLGKMRDPWQREVKKMLAEYKITPAPLVIDVDQRRDHGVFIPLLQRLLGTRELPQLLLQGHSLGSYHEVLEMREKGTLRQVLESSGAVSVRDAKKKKKGVRERERIENERILGPAPILDDTAEGHTHDEE
ncbi:hypothetical protein BCR39DRAFT_538708 [Naematelia encephala]|uniref:Uncharacterized protein n=1 Tax=Naematelia encephala TaxID=71784 RepID=A0A1Y2AX62_9TREE|nr:hypothetical protein BCR39DRAFT_538708 [Naematelia encephala]